VRWISLESKDRSQRRVRGMKRRCILYNDKSFASALAFGIGRGHGIPRLGLVVGMGHLLWRFVCTFTATWAFVLSQIMCL
jgi:hypothetical protein